MRLDVYEGAASVRVQSSFAKQGLMRTLQAELEDVAIGTVTICAPISDAIAQQHGYSHAGVLAAIADSACGYAALTTMPSAAEVLTIEFKLNLLAPAIGERLGVAIVGIRVKLTSRRWLARLVSRFRVEDVHAQLA